MYQFCEYSLRTTFSEYPANSAIQGSNNNEVIVEDQIDYNLILVQDDDLGTYIDIEFYKGDFDNPNTEEVFLLHRKTVDITPPS